MLANLLNDFKKHAKYTRRRWCGCPRVDDDYMAEKKNYCYVHYHLGTAYLLRASCRLVCVLAPRGFLQAVVVVCGGPFWLASP